MQNGRRTSSLQARQLSARGLHCHSRQCGRKFGYRHVLVSTSLDIADRAALLLGFELAALHQSQLTLLHATPRPKQDRVFKGLDAICLLHAAAEELRGPSASGMCSESAEFRLRKFVEDVVPKGLLETVSWRGECRPGNEAASIVSFVNESAVELVILSAKPLRWWLPIVPLAAGSIERCARKNVTVIRCQSSSQSS